jgi:diaminohydroxyphosphoribosylaminopyrimidine deaminase / 5-amino-6-(5-phosphoribosylamino)uracil reductase
MTSHEHFMRRALELAELGRGRVSSNPMVGCVIVHDGKIIGEGWHQKFGEAHAEVNAINSVHDKSLLVKSTVYVSLEPCSHYGKTPPCVDLLVRHHVNKVVISTIDTNPLVGGMGIKKLKAAGIEVETNILEKEGRELNKRFFHFIEKERPYIILKWAETADGFLAKANHDSKWISNEYSRQLVHKWRSEEDAILVGRNTAMHDNPQLNVREWTGRNPVRIVIDRFLKLSDKLFLFDQSQPTLVYNVLKHEENSNLTLVRIDEQSFLWNLLKDLYKRKIQSVIIEGGQQTLQHFIDEGLWDEARVFKSCRIFGTGISAPHFRGNLKATKNVIGDTLFSYTNSFEGSYFSNLT